jgi:hypothetical protein
MGGTGGTATSMSAPGRTSHSTAEAPPIGKVTFDHPPINIITATTTRDPRHLERFHDLPVMSHWCQPSEQLPANCFTVARPGKRTIDAEGPAHRFWYGWKM